MGDATAIRKGYTDTPDGQVRYLRSGSGRPMVLLHQSPAAATMWEAVRTDTSGASSIHERKRPRAIYKGERLRAAVPHKGEDVPSLLAYCWRLHQRRRSSRLPPDMSRVIGM